MQPVAVGVARSFGISLAVLGAGLFFLSACSTERKPAAEAPPQIAATPVNQTQQVQNNLPPPDLKTVQEAVKRVFRDAAVIDTTQQPSFITGDFNGDSSQDIAVVLKPAPDKLSAMNEDFRAWLLRDPLGATESKTPRLRIAADDLMLAVIHGFGANGWRDPQATQTFLLKHVVGSGMAFHPLREFSAANSGKKLPQLRGDLIGETLVGKPGYLYFNGADYAWYDPKTFAGEPEPRRGHGGQRTTL